MSARSSSLWPMCWKVLKENWGPIHSLLAGPMWVTISTWLNQRSSESSSGQGSSCDPRSSFEMRRGLDGSRGGDTSVLLSLQTLRGSTDQKPQCSCQSDWTRRPCPLQSFDRARGQGCTRGAVHGWPSQRGSRKPSASLGSLHAHLAALEPWTGQR